MLALLLSAHLASVSLAEREELLRPWAEYLCGLTAMKERDLQRAKADLAASPKSKDRRKDVDDLAAEIARIGRDPVGVLKGVSADSPFHKKPGALVYAVSERATVVEVTDEKTVLEVLGYTGGSGPGRSPAKSGSVSAGGITYPGQSIPVLDQFTVLGRLPGLRKGESVKMANWYRIVDAGGTKDKPTATAVPFRFTDGDVATIKRLMAEIKDKLPAEKK